MIFLPYIISTLIGLLTLNLILTKETKARFSLILILAFGLGLGISSILTFFSFIAFQIYKPNIIIFMNISTLIILLIFNFPKLKNNYHFYIKKIWDALNKNLIDALFWIIWFSLYLIINYLAQKQHPFGEWDAWAIWNLKLKFLLFSDTPWPDILHNLHKHTHPDYPFLLPCMNTWVYTMSSSHFPFLATMKTSVLFTMGCAWLLYAGTAQFMRRELAYFISLTILINPYFMFLSTSQYADIILAFYLLAALITLILTIRYQEARMAFLFGCILGLMTFLKNEGLVMAILLILLSGLYAIVKKAPQEKFNLKVFKNILIGFIIFTSATIYFKLFMAPANHDIIPNLASTKIFHFPIDNLITIRNYIFKEIFDKRWCYIWIFTLILTILGTPKLFYKEIKIITLFFLIYFSIVILIYMTSSQVSLDWWIKSSLRRIFQSALPSVLFILFYIHWRDKEKKISI